MPIEVALWRMDGQLQRLEPSRLTTESTLENALLSDVSMLGLSLLLIGHQVPTAYGTRIDLLAIDPEGDLYVIELKRDRTPREFVAQALDYGSWVRRLAHGEIAAIAEEYFKGRRLEEVYPEHFGTPLPETINQDHHLVIVASELDASSERIVNYLADFGVAVNVIFFRHFSDGDRSYLARTWLIDPYEAEAKPPGGRSKKDPWNGRDFYVSFGDGARRSWEDARRYDFISGGGGPFYSRTLSALQPGHRVFVRIPRVGYVGVGDVIDPSVPVGDFTVELDGRRVPILAAPSDAPKMGEFADDPQRSEYLVRVRWLKTVARDQAVSEKGLFANENTACKLRGNFTQERVLARLGIDA